MAIIANVIVMGIFLRDLKSKNGKCYPPDSVTEMSYVQLVRSLTQTFWAVLFLILMTSCICWVISTITEHGSSPFSCTLKLNEASELGFASHPHFGAGIEASCLTSTFSMRSQKDHPYLITALSNLNVVVVFKLPVGFQIISSCMVLRNRAEQLPRGVHRQIPTYGVGRGGGSTSSYPNY
jgi:hypothetical protein